MYNRRISKCHPRVEAYGTVDELTSALGMVRAIAPRQPVHDPLLAVQRDLVVLMGELACAVEDLPRYVRDGFHLVTAELTAKLDDLVRYIEAQGPSFSGWATPGATPVAAALDQARTVCRRAERCVCALHENQQLKNPEIIVYLNRLSDVLWLMARWMENPSAAKT
jgi:cob(I)alamin adenosyltransferase